MSFSSRSDSGRGLAPERPGLSQSNFSEGHENATSDINADDHPRQFIPLPDSSNDLPVEDGIDRVSQWATELDTLSTDNNPPSDDGRTDLSHPFRDESFPSPEEGSVASRAELYAEAFLENQTVEFEAVLTESDTPEGRFERQARSLALDLLQHHARRLNLRYPEESIFFQAAADRVPVHARGNAPYAHGIRSLHRPHRRYQAALFRHDTNGLSSPNADHGTSSSSDTTSDQSSHDETLNPNQQRRLRPSPPDDIQDAIVTYVTMYLAGQDEVVEWAASGDTTRVPYFPRLDQPGTVEYENSSYARLWALDVLEVMAWTGHAHLPQPAAFFADYDELMRHASRWRFQFPYTRAIVNGEETPTPVRSGEPHPEFGNHLHMTISIETVETVGPNDFEHGILGHDHGPNDPALPVEYGPNPNPGHFGPQRMLDLYNNFIENPEEYWNNDERILTFDEPPAPPPYGPHQQDEPHPVNEHADVVNPPNDSNDSQPPHGTAPSYRTSGPCHPHRHAPPPPTTEPRLNLLGEPITPRNSPPRAPSPPGPGPWDPNQHWGGDFAAALHATTVTTPPQLESPDPPNSPATLVLTIRNGVPSPEESPQMTRSALPHTPPRLTDPVPASTPANQATRASPTAPGTPPTHPPSSAPSTPPPNSPPSTPPTPALPPSDILHPLSPILLPPSHVPLPDSPPLLSPPLVPLPPSLPSSPLLLPTPIPPRNPNRSGLFGIVPRFPLLPPPSAADADADAEPRPTSPPPLYTARETSPPGLARGDERLSSEGEVQGEAMRWPEVREERRREWVGRRFRRVGSEVGGWRVLRTERTERRERGEGGVGVEWEVEHVGGLEEEEEWEGFSQGAWEGE
ncbi:hypothetical protein MMC17_005927 [Xylographa soralifera]|nr:hypothetical protein [Xylographa soralifera]